jgi:hypothetical protein
MYGRRYIYIYIYCCWVRMYGRRYAPSSFKCDVLGVYAAPSEYTVTNALVDRSVVAILSGRPVHVSCHFHVTVLLAAIALLAIQFDTMLELPFHAPQTTRQSEGAVDHSRAFKSTPPQEFGSTSFLQHSRTRPSFHWHTSTRRSTVHNGATGLVAIV